MRAHRTLAVLTAVVALGAGPAQASVLTTDQLGGSEVLLNLVNTTNSASYTLDLGIQFTELGVGDVFNLDAGAVAFISGAGGLANIDFGIIAAETGTRKYLTTSPDPNFLTTSIGNAVRGTWTNSVNELIANLNAGDATATTVNNGYGPFATGPSPNYVGGGHDLWQGSVDNTGSASNPLNIYLVTFGTSTLGSAVKTLFAAEPAVLSATQLTVGVVPAPPAVWLLGTALLGATRYARRRKRA
jgi:hypothetical protein